MLLCVVVAQKGLEAVGAVGVGSWDLYLGLGFLQSRFSGSLLAWRLWGKLQNLSFPKVSKQVVCRFACGRRRRTS